MALIDSWHNQPVMIEEWRERMLGLGYAAREVDRIIASVERRHHEQRQLASGAASHRPQRRRPPEAPQDANQ